MEHDDGYARTIIFQSLVLDSSVMARCARSSLLRSQRTYPEGIVSSKIPFSDFSRVQSTDMSKRSGLIITNTYRFLSILVNTVTSRSPGYMMNSAGILLACCTGRLTCATVDWEGRAGKRKERERA